MQTAGKYTTDADGWEHLAGARFVGPEEWLRELPEEWTRFSLHMAAFTTALASIAANDGVIIGYRPDILCVGALSDAVRDESDDPGWTLGYDRFVAMVLTDAQNQLGFTGYLAARGGPSGANRRLTLPAS